MSNINERDVNKKPEDRKQPGDSSKDKHVNDPSRKTGSSNEGIKKSYDE
jgi:hypothetical protein